MTVYNPPSLQELSGEVINRHVAHRDHIFKLEIPNILKKYLRKRFLNDRLYCTEYFPQELEDFDVGFEQPFMHLDIDTFIYFMTYKGGVPWFGYERNHIKIIYFTFEHDPDTRRCFDCAFDEVQARRSCTIKKFSGCDVESGGFLMDTLQCSSMWCQVCTTTALFFIEEYHSVSEHAMFDCMRVDIVQVRDLEQVDE